MRKAPVSAAVLSFGISPRIKLTGTTFPGTALCPQPSFQGKSQACQHSVSSSHLIPKWEQELRQVRKVEASEGNLEWVSLLKPLPVTCECPTGPFSIRGLTDACSCEWAGLW